MFTEQITELFKLFNKFFCIVTFTNVQIFYQNSIVVSETHVYVKASSSATQATCTSVPRIK